MPVTAEGARAGREDARRAVQALAVIMCPDMADHPEDEQYCLRPIASTLLSSALQEQVAEYCRMATWADPPDTCSACCKSIDFQTVTLSVVGRGHLRLLSGRLGVVTSQRWRRPRRPAGVAVGCGDVVHRCAAGLCRAGRPGAAGAGVRCFHDADEQIELRGKYLAEQLPVSCRLLRMLLTVEGHAAASHDPDGTAGGRTASRRPSAMSRRSMDGTSGSARILRTTT